MLQLGPALGVFLLFLVEGFAAAKAAEALVIQFEFIADHLLPLLALVGGENALDLLLGLLGKRGHFFLHALEVAALSLLEDLLSFFPGFRDDRLDVFLLLV